MSILKGRAFVIMLSVQVAFDKQLDIVSSYPVSTKYRCYIENIFNYGMCSVLQADTHPSVNV
jgi:hypothetical protein